MTENAPLPVKGYTGQSNDNVALANCLKEAEEPKMVKIVIEHHGGKS